MAAALSSVAGPPATSINNAWHVGQDAKCSSNWFVSSMLSESLIKRSAVRLSHKIIICLLVLGTLRPSFQLPP